MDEIQALQGQLQNSQIEQDSKQITANRGRLINKIRAEINKIKEDGVTPEEEQALAQMEALLTENIADHKDQLSTRYKEEFVDKSGSILSTVTALPKGVSLAVQKVKACITDLKEAKSNKERVFKALELLKASGLLVATPIIFTGKFLIKHWYLVLLFITYIFNIPGMLFKAGKETITKNFVEGKKGDLTNGLRSLIGQEPVEVEKTTFWKEFSGRFKDPEELKLIGEEAKERLAHLGTTIKNDYQAVKDGLKLVKDNWGLINSFIKNKYGVDINGMSDSVKEKITVIQDKLNFFKPNSPNAVTELQEINGEMNELTSMLTEPTVSRALG